MEFQNRLDKNVRKIGIFCSNDIFLFFIQEIDLHTMFKY